MYEYPTMVLQSNLINLLIQVDIKKITKMKLKSSYFTVNLF